MFTSSTLACLIRIVTDLNGLPYYTFKDPTLFRCSSQFLFENLLRSFFSALFLSALSFYLSSLAIFCFINIYILRYVHTEHKHKHIRIYCRIKTIKTIEIRVESGSLLHTCSPKDGDMKFVYDISIYGTHASNFWDRYGKYMSLLCRFKW